MRCIMRMKPMSKRQRVLMFSAIVCLSALIAVTGCGAGKEAEAYVLGLESYIYGYPLVLMDVTRQVLTAAPAPNKEGTAAPIGQFARMPHYVSPYFKNVVRISYNSLWTTGWVDLAQEPVVLSLPDTHGRYYVMSMMSMWTNVFGSVGKRTTGTASVHFLIVGPDWHGATPRGIKATFRSPTRYAWILGQIQANGPSDFPTAFAIEQGCKLTPLSSWGKPYTPPSNVPVDATVDTSRTPESQVAAMDAGTFFSRLAMVMKDNPPAPEDGPALEKLKRLGIEPGQRFDIDKIDPAEARGLQRAVTEVFAKMQEGFTKIPTANGWIQPPDLGRYGTDYNTRAGIALVGLGADMPEDTIYPTAFVDSNGDPLDSSHKYVMHYAKAQLPPTNATWSVSQYQGNFYVRNVLNRYAIAPWMPLKYNSDGSLDIYLQKGSPGPDKEANWLPTPSGPFNISIRNYWPKASAVNGTYKNPPIKKVP